MTRERGIDKEEGALTGDLWMDINRQIVVVYGEGVVEVRLGVKIALIDGKAEWGGSYEKNKV